MISWSFRKRHKRENPLGRLDETQRAIVDLELQKCDVEDKRHADDEAWRRYHAKQWEMLVKLEPVCSRIADLKRLMTELERSVSEKHRSTTVM